MLLLAWTPGISYMEDLGRHLLLGRIILEKHVVPGTNYLTFTHPDFPFVNHHWLSEVVLYLLHAGGGLNGLIVWKAAMMAAALGIALGTLRPRRLIGVYWIAGLLAAILMGFRAHIRPELFTDLFVALYGWFFERIRRGARWPRWAILPIACCWANAHIYFIFGIGMAAAFVLEQCFRLRASGVRVRNELLWLFAILLVSCIGPNGARGLLYPLAIFTNYGIAITENASPIEYWRSVVNPMLLALPFMTVLLVASVCASRQDGRAANRIIALVALAATWGMARSAPLLALAALPVIASALNSAHVARWRAPFSIFRFPLLATIALVLNGWLVWCVADGCYGRVFPSPIPPTPMGFDREERFTHLARLAQQGLRGPVFTDYNIGSLVEYQLYPEPGYCDNRPEAFPASFWRAEYIPALALTDRWREVCEQRHINAVIVSLAGVKEAYIQELLRRPEWVLVDVDEVCAVFVRNSPDNGALLRTHAFTRARLAEYERSLADDLARLPATPWWRRQVEAEVLVYRTYALLCIGEAADAWPFVRRLHELYPDYQIVHELMRVTVPRDEIPMVESVMARRARWPVAAKQVLDWANVLQQTGRSDEAERLLRRGRFFFPISPAIREASNRLADRRYLTPAPSTD